MRKTWAGAVVSAWVVAVLSTVASAGDPGAREWHQDAANGSRTSAVDVEPIRNDPVEAWRRKLDTGAICAPVTWGGAVFVVTKDAQKRQVLTALDARTGEVMARTVRLARTGDTVELVAWDGMVVAVEPTLVEGFAFKGSSFKPSWRRDGMSLAFPCVHRGWLFVAEFVDVGPRERIYGVADGKELGTSYVPIGGAVSVATPVRAGADVEVVGLGVGPLSGYVGTWLLAQTAGVQKPARSGQPFHFTSFAPDLRDRLFEKAGDGLAELTHVCALRPWYGVVRVAPESGTAGGAWLFLSGVDLKTSDGTPCQMFVQPDTGAGGLLPATIRPAVRAGRAYTFDTRGNILAVGTDGRFETVLDADKLPKGAVAGVPSIARNVICFGNWSVDLDSRRVLWIRPLDASQGSLVSPAIPIGDGLLLLRTSRGELSCLADPKTPTKPPPTAVAPPPAAMPKAVDGVLLRDGRQIAGAVLVGADGSVLLTPTGGAGQWFPASEVLLAEEDGVVLARGAEVDVHRVWRDGLRAAYVTRIEELLPAAVALGIPEKATQLLERARNWGMSGARFAELSRTIAGRRDSVNLDLKLKGFAKREGPVNDATYAEILEGAKWCGARGFPAVGAALLSLGIELDPARQDAEKAAALLVPPEFPTRGGGAARAWLAWAPFLLAADAHFLGDGDPAWRRTQTAPWNEGTIGLRTPNLLFFSRTTDAAVVGPCLARGEQAVRALRTLLEVEETAAPMTDEDRLEVRLHRDREGYVAEAGNASMEWTLGYFSPVANVSRFYVPQMDDSPLPLGRGLFTTMAHELTHHYVETRWAPRHGGSSPGAAFVPGFWVVEGIARFLEDQVVDSETRGLTFADATVPSVDVASQLARAGKLLPMDWFCDADQRAFHGLSPEPVLDVRLTRSLIGYRLSAANAYYEQAGALVYFLWNQRGAEGRTAFVEYLRLRYNGVLRRQSWGKLGFESAEALTQAFRDWLTSLGR